MDATLHIIERFNAAFNRHDVDAIMALMTDDCVFENTFPAPDGERYVGQAAVRAFWEQLFAASPNAVFEAEAVVACGEYAIHRWRYRWSGDGTNNPLFHGSNLPKVSEPSGGSSGRHLLYVRRPL